MLAITGALLGAVAVLAVAFEATGPALVLGGVPFASAERRRHRSTKHRGAQFLPGDSRRPIWADLARAAR
jgi:hypothetical protein